MLNILFVKALKFSDLFLINERKNNEEVNGNEVLEWF